MDVSGSRQMYCTAQKNAAFQGVLATCPSIHPSILVLPSGRPRLDDESDFPAAVMAVPPVRRVAHGEEDEANN